MFIRQNPFDGIWEAHGNGVVIRGEYEDVEKVCVALDEQQCIRTRVQRSLDAMNKQSPTSTWPEIAVAVLVVVLFIGATATAAWLW